MKTKVISELARETGRSTGREQRFANLADKLTLRSYPLGWKRTYWPEPKLGAKRADGFYQKPRAKRKSRWEKLADRD